MLPLYKPFMPNLPKLDDILHSGKLASGEYTIKFENALKEFLGVNNLIVTNSFNTAISVAVECLDLKRGDEIIASPMACLSSTQPYLTAGLKVKWVDVDPHLGTIDPNDLKKKISSKTKCIIHNHFCGYPGYIDEVNCIAHKNGIYVIDDGIECFGSKYKGKYIGACDTDISVFSFNPVRMLTTIDGGAVVFKNKKLYEKSILIRDCGIDRKIFRDKMGEINPRCDIKLLGYSATLSNINAYIGLEQLKSINKRLHINKTNANTWKKKLSDYANFKYLLTNDNEPNYWVFGVLIENNKEKILKNFRKKGIFASSVHINNNIYSIFGREKTMNGTKEFCKKFLGLPCGWWVNEKDIGYGY